MVGVAITISYLGSAELRTVPLFWWTARIGVNPQTIGYLERGDYKPSLELALKIARHFGVAVEMIFSLDRFAMTFGRSLR